ncbi:hypothetical protein KI387_003937, partial [Taxus chinensis]
IPKLEPEFEALQVNITTCAEAARAKEALQQRPTIPNEDVVHAKYPDPTHQKEVYQETIEVLRNLQGEIQYLKEKSHKMEQKKASETVQYDMDDLKE